jgi:translocation protein SEC63
VPPLVFAPYFARDHSPRWHVFLTDSKQGKMAVPPFTFAQFDRPIFNEDGKTPTYEMQTLKAQFQAPPQAGHYTFVMHVVCDSYVGFDTKMEVTLVVEEASRATEMSDDDDISEPEEGEFPPLSSEMVNLRTSTDLAFQDSIAGIMNAAKGNAPPPRKRRKEEEDEEDSDEESGTDEEADDTSDTNTDTEDES